MTKTFLTLLFLYLTLLLEVAVATDFAWAGFQPSFLAVALVGWVLREQANRRLLLAATIGFLGDCFSGGPLGIGMMLAVLSIGLIEIMAPKEQTKFSSLFQAILVLVLYVMGTNSVLMVLAGKTELWPQTLWQSTGTILYSSLLIGTLSIIRAVGSRFWSHSEVRYAR